MGAIATRGNPNALLELRVFGRPRLFIDRREVPFRRRQPLAILSILALSDRPVTRDELTYLIWPDATQEIARQRLRRSLSELRQTLGPDAAQALPDPASLSGNLLYLDPRICRVDAREFLSLFDQARALPDPDGLRAAEQAASLGVAPLLHGLDLSDAPEFENWLRDKRELFERLRLDVLRRMAQGYAALGDYARALATVEQALTLDALSEDLHRKAMWLYAVTGRRSDAARQYAWCAALLHRELVIPPDDLTRALHQAILEDRAEAAREMAFPALTDSAISPRAQSTPPAADETSPAAQWPPASLRDELAAALAPALRGAPRVLWVTGPAGAGKNRLVQAALSALPQDTATADLSVWSVSARGLGDGAPFELMRALLDTALRERLAQVARRPGLSAGAHPWSSEATRLLPELRAAFSQLSQWQPVPLTDLPGAAPQSVLRRRLFQALPRALRALAGNRPVVIALNDLDSADAASIEATGWLARALDDHDSPLALVITCREIENGSPELNALLTDLRARGLARVWTTPPLDRVAALALGRQYGIPAGLSESIWQRAAGSTVAMLEMLRAAAAAGRRGKPDAPASLRAAIEINLRALDPVTRQVLEAAAILGGETAHWLQHVSGRAPDEVERACDTLLACGWFTLAGDRYIIGSPEVRQAALDQLSVARRQRLHSQAALLLRQHGRDAHIIARHLEAAGQPDQAAEMWLQAARRAQELYVAEAALAAVQRGLALTGDPRLQFELLCEQETALHILGRRDAQADTLSGLQQLAEAWPDHSEWRAVVYYRRGRYALARNDWQAAVDMLQRAAACALQGDGDILRLLARALAHSRRWDEAETVLQRALTLAEQNGDTLAVAQCWLARGQIAASREQYEAAEAAVRRAVELAGSQAALLPHLMLELGALASLRNDFAGALTYAQEALRLFSRRGVPDAEAAAHVLAARMCARLGRLDEALEAYQAAYAGYAALDLRQGMAAARVNASTLALRSGDLEAGARMAQEAYALFEAIQDARGLCVSASNVGAALVWMGRGAEGERWLRESAERAATLNLPAQQAAALANLGAALLQEGRAAEARPLMEQGLAMRASQGHIDASIDRAFLAIACLRLGDLPAADAHSAQALAEAERLPQVENPQQVWFARAQVLRALGRPAEAQAMLDAAVAHLRRIEQGLPEAQRERFCHAFPFNRAILRAHQEGAWPDPPALV